MNAAGTNQRCFYFVNYILIFLNFSGDIESHAICTAKETVWLTAIPLLLFLP